MKKISIQNEAAMTALGERLSKLVPTGAVLLLQGELGAGKTTFTRGFLHGLGHRGKVKSPTYTLVESYHCMGLDVHHFDLYRLNDAAELELMGFRDYFNSHSVVIIEWPEKAGKILPSAALTINIEITGHAERQIKITGKSSILTELN